MHLTSMGITRHGPRLIILGVIQRKKELIEFANRPSTSTAAAPQDARELTIRELLQSDKPFAKKILYPQLDRQQVPQREHICWMVRILCRPWHDTILEKKVYPTMRAKKNLALKILQTFPHLKSTAIEGGSEESGFFYANGGKGNGHEHTGFIQRHIRNMAANIPSEHKKYRRRQVPQVEDPELVKVAEKCAKKESTTANFVGIKDNMLQCVQLHITLIERKKSVSEIMTIFPHFRSYNGKLIQQFYEAMHENYNKNVDLKSIFSKGMLLGKNAFERVEDDVLRGCLRIMLKLNNKGIKRNSDGVSVSIEEELAAQLIRWIPDTDEAYQEQLGRYAASYIVNGRYPPPHIMCKAETFKAGPLSVYIEGEVIRCKDSMVNCIDVLLKAFFVLNVKPPATLYKIIDFMAVIGYKVMKSSKRAVVNQLCNSISDYERAIASSDDED